MWCIACGINILPMGEFTKNDFIKYTETCCILHQL